MAKNFKIKGLKKVLKKLDKFGDEAIDVIAETTELTAEEIAKDAKSLAPKDKGDLAQSIRPFKINNLNWGVVVKSEYGAYVEFGTGGKVKVPSELSKEAARFKGRKGDFKKGLENIKEWCKRIGIPVEAAYPIFMSIIKNGVEPQPFLYPAFVLGKREYVAELKSDLKYLTKKANGKI